MDSNRLGEETSPYLLQHKDNPVHWQAWGAETLAAAEAADKPILLSVGYAACHWCHVMAHESFENPEIAALMNEHFVNIKVDREERPDLDAIYQNALALAGRAGRLAADDVPDAGRRAVLGRHLFPARAALGPAGLPAGAARRSRDAYRERPRQGREERRRAARGAAAARPARSRRAAIDPALLDRIAERLLREVDPLNGGIGTAPKFPQCGDLRIAVARLEAHRPAPYPRGRAAHARRRCARAASTTISAAALPAMPPTRAGWCRISRRCSTTTPSSSSC